MKNDNFSIVTLPHPGHGQPTKYCLDDLKNKIYELVTFSEPYRSWFIGETVKSDGSLLMVTPVNPIFLGISFIQDTKPKNNYLFPVTKEMFLVLCSEF